MDGVYQGLLMNPVTIKILVNNNAKFEQTKKSGLFRDYFVTN